MDNMEKRIGKRIAEARCSRGMTQDELAEQCCLSVSTISRIETGRNSAPVKTLLSISSALTVGLDYILYDLIPRKNASDFSPQVQEILLLLESMKEQDLLFVQEFLALYRSKLQ